ncbi:hypothetical protein D3C77_331210 [compost metagenome]
MEHPGPHRLQHPFIEHQGGDVSFRNDRALLTRQASRFTEPEEAFDLLVDPSDRLYFTKLVDRTSDGETLLERSFRQGRDQRASLTQRGTVTVHVTVGLFQGNTRRNRQRELLGIATAQVSGEDHHPLGVNRLAEVDLTLDVDDATATGVHRCRDPRWYPEGRVTNFQHGQAIALADCSPFGVDEDDSGEHVVENPRRNSACAGGLGLECPFDMANIGHLIVGQVTNEVRLADQLEQVADTRRQAPLVFGQACAVGCQASHGICAQRRHTLLAGAGLEQLGELLQAFVDHGDVFVEVDQYPEHFLEVRIMILQGVIQLTRADDHHFNVQRDHLRIEGDGGQAAVFTQR